MRYAFTLTCPYCAGQCEHVTHGATTTWETRGLVRCLECDAEVIVVVQLHATVDNHQARHPIANHGTEAGYQAHRRRQGVPCADCATAHNAYTAHRKAVTLDPERRSPSPQSVAP